MASLEELLGKDGFKRGKAKNNKGSGSSLPSYSPRSPIDSSEYISRRNRSKSAAFSHRSQSLLPSESGRDQGKDLRRSVLLQKNKESLKSRVFDNESHSRSREIEEEFEERYHGKDRGKDFRRSILRRNKESMKITVFDNGSYNGLQESEHEFEERYSASYPDSLNEGKSQEEENLYSELVRNRGSYKMSHVYEIGHDYDLHEEENAERNGNNVKSSSISELKLHEIAAKALISILTGYLRGFFDVENFWASFYQNCSSFLGISDHNEGGAISNLKQAVSVIERAINGSPSTQELKRAALQLSVITGLSSVELKDGFTCGIPNLYLSSCAHIYLGVTCKFQKKDMASAKHILQVFCDCPNQARNTLLPDLWDRLFSLHLSHLKEWYDNGTELISRTQSRAENMDLLEEVYNNSLDVGTYQFAVYYKKWLMKEVEGPEIPCIVSPLVSFMGLPVRVLSSLGTEEFRSPGSSKSSQAMVSKSLYESVFRHSPKKIEMDEGPKKIEKEENGDSKFFSEDDIPVSDVSSHIIDANEWMSKGCKTSNNLHLLKVKELKIGSKDLQSSPTIATENELTLKKLAEAAFHQQVTNHNNDTQPSKGSYEDIDQDLFFSSIPKDFVCPITGQLFQDPVTIESGITYERAAIIGWFDRGNKTCPVTRRALESVVLPVTNFVLKRLTDGWKSEHCRNILVLATKIAVKKQEYMSKDESALFIIEQLFSSFSIQEQMENTRHLISLGGLQFLLRRLELGDLEEKTRVSSLLLCCIKANGFCRHYLAANIGQSSILELLHCNQVAARANAVSLLIELICLNRRTAINLFISSLQKGDIGKTMHVLLVYLQSGHPEERVMVAVLLLHFDLMVEPTRYSLYREEAVDSIIFALRLCLSAPGFIPNSRRALLMLGGHFSSSGETLTETWLLKQAGFYNSSCSNATTNDVESDEIILELLEIPIPPLLPSNYYKK